MKAIACALAASTLLTFTLGISIGQRTPAPQVLGLDLGRNSISAHNRNRLRRRAGTVSETLDNEETLYYANVTIGTPAQSLRLHIDTGSSDLWVNTANSTLCEDTQEGGCQGGTYSPSSSSTYKFVNSEFNISYVDGSASSGDYVTDTLRIGGETLTDFQFGLGFTSSSAEGVLGIGYALNEVQVNRGGLDSYPNLPKALVNAGLINTNAYSLWLNDLDASTGTILFGGVNTAKYTGELATMPILQEDGVFVEFNIALTGLSLAGNSLSSTSLPAAALLDSGTTLTYLPNAITNAIFTKVNAVYDSQEEVAYVECDLKNSDSSIDFDFSGQTISVPYNELVLDETFDSNGNPLTFSNGEPACAFGIAYAGDSTIVLGDTFLRSAYVVYDLTYNQISLAQTDFNSTGEDVREIIADNVPGATVVSSAITTVAAGTGGARLNGPTSTPTNLTSSGAIFGGCKLEFMAAALMLVAIIMAKL